ncbi:penicillin-binding protein 2 [Candidatus Dependentiae bacterium]|nr:penicillin-binding protein 2 [Candidatus Dependentiae bacterium]
MDNNNSYIRSLFILFLFLSLYSIIAINLYFIQIKKTVFFKELADKQYNVTIQTYPPRGLITDRNKKAIAINTDSSAAFILPKELLNKEQTLSFLKKNFPSAYQRFKSYKNKSFMFVKRNLDPEDIQLIQNSQIPDLYLLKESSRFYPYESLGSIIGITDIDNNGLFGIEQLCNSQLQGTPSIYHLKKNAKNKHFYFSQETATQGENACPITLTIDADLQFKFQQIIDQSIEKLKAKEAAALAMDPITGEIYAMVSWPYFNPNQTKNLDLETTKNRPLSECFEAGSVIKVFAALAALEENIVTIDEIIDCEGRKETKIDHLPVRTVIAQGAIPFMDVIKFSNNIGMVKVTKKLGSDLYKYYTLLGFGSLTGINFPGEQKGFVNPPQNWSAYSLRSLSFGYEITTNLLQLARAFSVLINGGYLVTPTIIKTDTIKKEGPIISQKTISTLSSILEETIQNGSGKQAKIDGYKILGKTGTANLLVNGNYDDDKHLYTFIGSIEYNNYKRVVVVYIKETKTIAYASIIAAPLFRALAEAMIMHDHIFIEKD